MMAIPRLLARAPLALALLALALLALAPMGCVPDAGPPEGIPQSPFFDLQGYFEAEVERLTELAPPVRKTVWFDGAAETKRLDSVPFRDELKVFLDADINRPAWWDRYTIDSTLAEGALRAIQYTAMEEDLKVRSIRLTFRDDSLRVVDIELAAASAATDFEQQLRYEPARGYTIQTRQNVILSEAREMRVEAEFLE